MRRPSERFFNVLFSLGWMAVLAEAFMMSISGLALGPSQLLGVLLGAYLSAWGLFFFRSRRGKAGDAARFLLCTFSILFLVGTLEVAGQVGILDYRTIFRNPTEPWERPTNRPDPELLYVRSGPQRVQRVMTGNDIARLHGARSWKIYKCDVSLDRNGFRNPAGLETAEVVVVGDSFIEGMQVAETEVITSRLAEQMDCRVANLGRAGDGPQQELEVFKRFGLELKPKTCVWAFYEGNDLPDATCYEMKRQLVCRYADLGARQNFGARSFTLNLLENVIRTRLNAEPRPPARLYRGKFNAAAGTPVDIFFASDDQHDEQADTAPREYSPGLRRARAALAQAHAVCRERGIDLVVAFIPTKFRVYRDLCQFDPDSPCKAWPVDDLPGTLLSTVSQVSPEIGFLDLTRRFHAEAAAGALVYLPDDTHWTEDGHRFAAVELAGLLKARGPKRRPVVASGVEDRQTR